MRVWDWLRHTGLLLIGRGIAATAGLALLYAALFLYEDEEKRVGDRLVDVWVRITAAGERAGSRRLAFVREAARLTERWFGWVFGPRLLSARSAIVSAFLAWSLALCCVVVLGGDSPDAMGTAARMLLGGYLLLHAAVGWRLLVPRRARARAGAPSASSGPGTPRLPAGVTVLLLLDSALLIAGSLGSADALPRVVESATEVVIIILGGWLANALMVATVRSRLLDATTAPSAGGALTRLASTLALGVGLCVVPIVTGSAMGASLWGTEAWGWNARTFGDALQTFGLVSIFDALIAMAFFVVVVGLALHWVIWPLLGRLVYAAIRYDVVRRKKALVAAAAVLVAAAVPQVGTLIEKISGVLGR